MDTYLTRNLDNRTRRLNHQPRRLNLKLRTILSAFLLHPSTPIPEVTLLGPLSGIWEARHVTYAKVLQHRALRATAALREVNG